MKREGALKSAWMKELKLQAPNFVVLLLASAGGPDREITGNHVTTHWECKHATPHFKSPGLQNLICMRLAEQGYCRYVIWHEDAGVKHTLIVHPRAIHEKEGKISVYDAEIGTKGFDHRWLTNYVLKMHGWH